MRTPPSQPRNKRDRQFVLPNLISTAMADVTMLPKVHVRTPPSLRLVELHPVPHAGVPRDIPAASCTSTCTHQMSCALYLSDLYCTGFSNLTLHTGDRVTGDKSHPALLLRVDSSNVLCLYEPDFGQQGPRKPR